ncbi:NUDIX hydrolase (plasmid) [Sphaerimonospora sp. CA-214678]|uniref:NUDIX hydrolase n=1 Tax=Sphaerimonospora sp. CA-214678 TaxID=3240029 RepID=UPI003D91731D
MTTTEDKQLAAILVAISRDLGRAKKLIREGNDHDESLRRSKQVIEALQEMADDVRGERDQVVVRISREESASLSEIARRASISKSRAAQIVKAANAQKETDHMAENATAQPDRPPVVAGIVTSERGVLIGKRTDGKPPWTFIAGEVEPGETPSDAIMREVKEETGLRVIAAHREIGRRVHPKTGRTMIYMACSPTGKTDVFLGDPDELEEVRWANLNEVDELLPGLFEPVRAYLVEQLGHK